MRQRCANPRNKDYSSYGGRGITVCGRWGVFENFLADMGEKPAGLSIDRIDNDGNYEPGNCRWASIEQQSQNRRSTRLTPGIVNEIRGRHEHGETVRSIAARFVVHDETVRQAVNRRTWRHIP
jgi:hypothetical protein